MQGSGKGESEALPYTGLEGRTMRQVAVGPAGVWAVAKVCWSQLLVLLVFFLLHAVASL